jgi:hypothetical protein
LPPVEMAVDTGETDCLEFALSPFATGVHTGNKDRSMSVNDAEDTDSDNDSHIASVTLTGTATSPSSLHVLQDVLKTADSDEISAPQCGRVSNPSSPTARSDVHTDVARPLTTHAAISPSRPVATKTRKRRNRKRGGPPSSLPVSSASPFTVTISKPRPSTSISPPSSKRVMLSPEHEALRVATVRLEAAEASQARADRPRTEGDPVWIEMDVANLQYDQAYETIYGPTPAIYTSLCVPPLGNDIDQHDQHTA